MLPNAAETLRSHHRLRTCHSLKVFRYNGIPVTDALHLFLAFLASLSCSSTSNCRSLLDSWVPDMDTAHTAPVLQLQVTIQLDGQR